MGPRLVHAFIALLYLAPSRSVGAFDLAFDLAKAVLEQIHLQRLRISGGFDHFLFCYILSIV